MADVTKEQLLEDLQAVKDGELSWSDIRWDDLYDDDGDLHEWVDPEDATEVVSRLTEFRWGGEHYRLVVSDGDQNFLFKAGNWSALTFYFDANGGYVHESHPY